MATTATLTVNAEDIIGADFDKSRASVWVETNTPHSLIVVDGTSVRVGGRRENLIDGVATFELVTTDSADNPESFSYRVTIVYVPKGSRKQGHDQITTSDFPLTADANLAAIPEAWDELTATPPNWRSDFLDQAQALLDEQSEVAGLTGEDGAVAFLVGSGSSSTRLAVNAAAVTQDASASSPIRVQQDARLTANYARRDSTPANVKNYGAIGNGTTDDTAAIQAAIAANNGVWFPAGTYKISAALNLHNGSRLVGDGPSSKIKQTANTYAIRGTSVSNVVLENLWVEGFGTGSTIEQGAVHMTGCTRVAIKGCRIYNHGTAVWVTASSDILVADSELDTFKRYGLVLSTSSYWRVIGNNIHGSSEAGAGNAYCISASSHLAGSLPQRACLIANNHLADVPAWDAIMTHETDDLTISGNWIRNVRTGIDVGPNGGSTTNKRLVITGNTIQGTSTNTWGAAPAVNAGISLIGDASYAVTEVVVSGNHVEGFNRFPATTGSGGVLLVNVRNITVTGNMIRDIDNAGGSNQGGITMAGTVRGVTISGNTCTDTGLVGVSFYNIGRGQGINVTGNTFRKDASGTMAAGVLFDSTRLLDCSVNNNQIDGLVQHVTQGGSAYLPLPAHTDVMMGGQLALAHPRRDPISRVGATMTGDTLGAKVRVCTFRRDTTATATASAGATSVTVASNANILASDTLYAVMDNGTWHASNVTGIGTGTVTLSTAVPAGRTIPSGNEVWVVRWTNGA